MKSMPNDSTAPSAVAAVLAIWFGLVVVLGASGAFVRAPGTLPLLILVGVMAPLVVFLVMFGAAPEVAAAPQPRHQTAASRAV